VLRERREFERQRESYRREMDNLERRIQALRPDHDDGEERLERPEPWKSGKDSMKCWNLHLNGIEQKVWEIQTEICHTLFVFFFPLTVDVPFM